MIQANKVDNWWTCKECGRSFEVNSKHKGYTVCGKGYYCEDCFKSGIIWAIAMAYKERNDR